MNRPRFADHLASNLAIWSVGSASKAPRKLSRRSCSAISAMVLSNRGFRRDDQIAVYRDGKRAERGEIILHEAASHLL